jgi:hypothetical protein
MVMDKKNTFYIVVVFYDGLGYTLQEDEKVHLFFHYGIKGYKKLAYAIKKANRLAYTYVNEKTCIFKVEEDERISCDQYSDWYKDKDRLVYENKGIKL